MRLILLILAVALVPQAIADEPRLILADALSVPEASAPAALPLTLEETVRLALEGQPQLAAQSARVTETRENAVAAGELPDPRLSFGLMSVPLDSFNLSQEEMTQGVIGVSQMIPGGDKRRLEREGLLRQAESGEAALEAVRRGIARDAGLAWLDLWYPDAALKLVQDIEREYERQLEWAQTALAANRLSQEETLALRVMREYVADRKDELARQQARARARLSRWIGDTARRPLSPGLASSPSLSEPKLDAHPELTAMQRDMAAAQAEVDLAREAYKPDWAVDLSYGVRGGNRTDFVSALVSVDLPLFTEKRQDRRLAGKLAAVERTQYQLRDRRLQLQADMEAALADWEAADRRIKHFEATLIPLAERRVESALAGYRAGKGSFATVIEARREDLEARMQLLDQQVARARAAVELRYFSD
jgi:outer membrane protein, heavy metal efflux system